MDEVEITLYFGRQVGVWRRAAFILKGCLKVLPVGRGGDAEFPHNLMQCFTGEQFFQNEIRVWGCVSIGIAESIIIRFVKFIEIYPSCFDQDIVPISSNGLYLSRELDVWREIKTTLG